MRKAEGAFSRVEERLKKAAMLSTQKVKNGKGGLSRDLLRQEIVRLYFWTEDLVNPHDQLFALQAQKEDFDSLAEAGESLLMLIQEEIMNKEDEAEDDLPALEQLIHQQAQSQTSSQSTDSIGGRLPLIIREFGERSVRTKLKA